MDVSTETALVLPLSATVGVRGGWRSWSRDPPHPSCTNPDPRHTRRVSQGRESALWDTVRPACCLSQWVPGTAVVEAVWGYPHVLLQRVDFCFKTTQNYVIFLLFPPHVKLTLLFSAYGFISTAGYRSIIYPNQLLETKRWMSTTRAGGTRLQNPSIASCLWWAALWMNGKRQGYPPFSRYEAWFLSCISYSDRMDFPVFPARAEP